MSGPKLAKVYTAPDLEMMLRVIQGPQGPGVIDFKTLRSLSADQIQALGERLTILESRKPVKWDTYVGSVTTAGQGVITFPTNYYSEIPVIVESTSWIGDQMVIASPITVTKTGVQLAVKQSRGTLLLNSGPYQNAPVGSSYKIIVLGR